MIASFYYYCSTVGGGGQSDLTVDGNLTAQKFTADSFESPKRRHIPIDSASPNRTYSTGPSENPNSS